MLLNPYRFGGPPSATLTGLISYWKLDEASGDAVDTLGVNNLTNTNAVGATTGLIGGARSFLTASSRYFTKAVSGADLSTGDIDFTFSAWFRGTTYPGSQNMIVSKWKDSSSQWEFMLFVGSTGSPQFYVRNGATSTTVTASGAGVPAGTWGHVICWHDSVNNLIGICLNNNTPVTAAHSVGAGSFPAMPFWVGSKDGTAGYWNGELDEIGFWKRMLTAAERATLYNAGDGLTHPFVEDPPGLLNMLRSYWKMDEASGNAIDTHGTNHLTDTNAVGSDPSGRIGGARSFVRTSSKYFVKPVSGTSLSTGDISFTLSCWVKAFSLSGTSAIISKWSDPTSTFEWFLSHHPTQNRFAFYTWIGANNPVHALNFGVVPLNVWLHVMCWYDSVADQFGICVNNGTPNTLSSSPVVAKPAIPFWIGSQNGTGSYWDGLIDEVGFWKRMLTPAERTLLYNGGSGLAYPFS